MSVAYETGTRWSSTLPAGQRTYYESLLLETLRTKSVLIPFTVVKEDFRARDTGVIVYSEVMDTDPDYNALAETTIWLTGAHLDSRSVQIQLEIHGDTIKISDYNELVNYWNGGDLRGIVQGKLGQNQVDYLDILARNAFLSAPYKTLAGGRSTIYGLLQTDVFDPDYCENARTHLEEREVPGVASPEDGGGGVIVCVTSPRVIHDIRTAVGSKWLEVQGYAGGFRKFNSEAGMWNGVRFIKTNRLRLFNYGLVGAATTLDGATIPGQGSAATVDSVYSVGQSGSTRTVDFTSAASFAVGDVVTIHSASVYENDGAGGKAPSLADGTQETRRIVSINTNAVAFDRPLLKAHASGALVTKGVTLNASIFMGGPAVVYGVGERPHPIVLPKIDDMGMVQRFTWRGFVKLQMFRPELLEVVWSGGSTD